MVKCSVDCNQLKSTVFSSHSPIIFSSGHSSTLLISIVGISKKSLFLRRFSTLIILITEFSCCDMFRVMRRRGKGIIGDEYDYSCEFCKSS